MGHVQRVQARANDGDDEGKRHVHVKAGSPNLAQRHDVKKERINGDGQAACHEHNAVPPFDAAATRVNGARPGEVLRAAFEVRRDAE